MSFLGLAYRPLLPHAATIRNLTSCQRVTSSGGTVFTPLVYVQPSGIAAGGECHEEDVQG